MRWLALAFVVLIAALQYPMWLGKGGWLQVRDLDRQLAAQKESNSRLKLRNDALDAEVRDLKNGFEAVEERARAELGMVKQDEQNDGDEPHVVNCRVEYAPPCAVRRAARVNQ